MLSIPPNVVELQHRGRNAVLPISARSKPTRFVLGLIPHFVRQRLDQLSDTDIDAAFRTYSEYVALYCSDILGDEQLRGYAIDWALHALSQVTNFPRKSGAAGAGE